MRALLLLLLLLPLVGLYNARTALLDAFVAAHDAQVEHKRAVVRAAAAVLGRRGGAVTDAAATDGGDWHAPQPPAALEQDEESSDTHFGSDDAYSVPVCHEVHAFYYPWYGTPAVDGKWLHWDHRQLPHWNAQIAAQHPTGRHVPPGDIGADFTPLGGPYSSRDPAVLARHMRQLRLAGVGTLVASWFPPGRADDNGAPLDEVWPAMLAAADDAGLTVAPHLEPYEGRTAQSVGRDVAAFLKRFGGSAALYRRSKRPVVYVYDSNRIAPEAWGEVLTRGGGSSLRGGGSDVFAVGLITTAEEVSALARSGFDAAYTYFASHGQTFAARPAHWAQLATRLRALGLELVPSVGPGYSDRAVRPWNGGATAARANGSYYDAGWRAALEADTPMVAVTSFNEWHEGTQIEPAVPAERSGAAAAAMGGGVYEDYRPMPPDGYLTRTRLWAMRFKEMRSRHAHSVREALLPHR